MERRAHEFEFACAERDRVAESEGAFVCTIQEISQIERLWRCRVLIVARRRASMKVGDAVASLYRVHTSGR